MDKRVFLRGMAATAIMAATAVAGVARAQSEPVRQFIVARYQGSVVPAF